VKSSIDVTETHLWEENKGRDSDDSDSDSDDEEPTILKTELVKTKT